MINSYFFLYFIKFNGDNMEFKVGDIVTRNSYNNDTLFKISKIEDDICYLIGINVRLCADSLKDDLKLSDTEDREEEFLEKIKPKELERNDYFYLPGKILHIDGDKEYLNRCLDYYNNFNIMAAGVLLKESNIPDKIYELLNEYNPDIVVITGHDAYLKKRNDSSNINLYKNSLYFKKAIEEARRFENSHEKLVIIAGGCQSDYEELIKAGANFASSPKRVNIHALDPAIVATKMSLSDIAKDIDIKDILENTKYGAYGIGGIITKGTMHVGYPR